MTRSGDPNGPYGDTDSCISSGVPSAHAGGEEPRAACADQCNQTLPSTRSSESTSSRTYDLIILGVLVGIDLVTKAAAISLLYKNTPVDVGAPLQFVLRTNPSGLGTWALAANPDAASPDRLAASLGYLALAIGLQLLRRAKWSRWSKTLAAFTVFGAAYALGLHLTPQLGSIPSPVFVALSRLGPAALFASLWWLAAPGLWRTTTTLFTAAALGNLLSLVLPPHEVIDFIYSKPLSTVFRQGVVNIADLYFDAGILCLLLLLGRTYLARLRVGSTRAHDG